MTIQSILSYDPTTFDFVFADVMRIIVIVFSIQFHAFLIRYVYQDTHERGIPNKILWTFLVIFLNVLGVILYYSITTDLTPRVRIASALWMFNAFIILIIGGLLFFTAGPSSVQSFLGYFFIIFILLPITLFIIGSGICALWIGVYAIKGYITGSEINRTLILACLGPISFLVAFLPMFLVPMNPFGGYVAVFGMCFVILIYAYIIRNKVAFIINNRI
ncbi:MAG: PLDc N-terminal domain-containing protein [Candidatus Hodarchaeales archaeon]